MLTSKLSHSMRDTRRKRQGNFLGRRSASGLFSRRIRSQPPAEENGIDSENIHGLHFPNGSRHNPENCPGADPGTGPETGPGTSSGICPEHGPIENAHNCRNCFLGPRGDPRGPVDPDSHGAPQIYLGIGSTPSSSQSSVFSFNESNRPLDYSEYDESFTSNTLDADSGRRLWMLQTSMCNPELSPSVRSVLVTAYRQFEKQSTRTSETLPSYSQDCKPPPYSV